MYNPTYFRMEDRNEIIQFIKENSFGILFSTSNQIPQATHLPFLIDENGEFLLSHMAIANPQWKHIDHEVLVVFQGPHAYISPTWYAEENTVPTWNYVTVHVQGEFIRIEDRDELINLLDETVNYYEKHMPSPWKMDRNSSYVQNLLNGTVGFKIRIKQMEGKKKLNQNHPLERQERVVQGLRNMGDPNSLQIADLMEKNIKK